eukprot:836069-Rhodomonas_salina.1
MQTGATRLMHTIALHSVPQDSTLPLNALQYKTQNAPNAQMRTGATWLLHTIALRSVQQEVTFPVN